MQELHLTIDRGLGLGTEDDPEPRHFLRLVCGNGYASPTTASARVQLSNE